MICLHTHMNPVMAAFPTSIVSDSAILEWTILKALCLPPTATSKPPTFHRSLSLPLQHALFPGWTVPSSELLAKGLNYPGCLLTKGSTASPDMVTFLPPKDSPRTQMVSNLLQRTISYMQAQTSFSNFHSQLRTDSHSGLAFWLSPDAVENPPLPSGFPLGFTREVPKRLGGSLVNQLKLSDLHMLIIVVIPIT